MSQDLELFSQDDGLSTFDQIRRFDESGEYWSARELQSILGYEKWERFEGSIDRARSAMINTGQDPDANAGKINDLGVGYARTDLSWSKS